MSQIVHLIIGRLVDTLKQDCITAISSSDPTRVDAVHMYKFQENPLAGNNVYLYVTGGDPNDPTLKDGRVHAKEMEDLGIRNFPTGEIGGGHYWWRRGHVELGCFFISEKYTQEVAANYAHQVHGRVINSLERAQIVGLVDIYQEQAYYIYVFATTMFEGGGPPDQYIWRGNVQWQVLTHRPN